MCKFHFLMCIAVWPLLHAELNIKHLDEIKLHSVYLMQQNRIEESFARYREYSTQAAQHDFETLQQMGLILLNHGAQSTDDQLFMMTLFGAGLSGSTGALEILERGLDHEDPQIQLLALHFLVQFEDDRINEVLSHAMNSNYLSTRMEAAFYMAQRKHPHAVGQIEGLMFRLPPAFKPYFPSFFALLGTDQATAALRRLIEDPNPQVRIESILNVAQLGRDDFLPILRKRMTHSQIAELEASAFAIGILKDSSSIAKLRKLTASASESVQLAAALALLNLGDRSFIPLIIQMARKKNIFAIASLGSIEEGKETLIDLVTSQDLQIRSNAAIALLRRRDSRCFTALCEILLEDIRDLAFYYFPSVGRTQIAIKAIPSAELHAKDANINLGFSIAIREHFLREAAHLPEEDFLQLARLIFKRPQNDLVPTLIALLENLRTDRAIALLEEGSKTLSTPLIRDYCHLALFRLKKNELHKEYINHWVMRQKHEELIRLRPLLPWKFRLEQSDYTLTPDETSRLLIEAFLSIANQRDEESIDFLLEAIQYSNPVNRYALIGLLMKATE